MIRRASLAAVVLLVLALPSGAVAAPTAGTGTSRTALDLVTLQMGALPAVSLGTLDSYASTDPDPLENAAARPYARVRAVLPGGTQVSANSDDGPEVPGYSAALPTGTLTLGRLQASAAQTTASSRLEALRGDVGAAGTAVRATLPATGLFSAVDGVAATASNGALLTDLAIDLTDLLPADLLAQLPLSTLLDLAGLLPLDLTADLAAVVAQIRALADEIGALAASERAIDDLQARLDELADDLAAAEDALAEAEAAAAAADEVLVEAQEAAGDVTDVVDEAVGGVQVPVPTPTAPVSVPGVPGVTSSVRTTMQAPPSVDEAAAAAAAVAAAATEASDLVDTINAVIDATQAQLDTVVGQVGAVLDTLEGLLAQVGPIDLLAVLRGLVEGLEGAELLAVDELLVGVVTSAHATGSSAAAACQVRGVRVLGRPADVGTCDELGRALAGVDTAITSLLANLPVVSTVTADTVKVRTPRPTVSDAGARDGAYHLADAAITPLSLEVGAIGLTQVTDSLVAEVTGLVGGALDDLGTLAGVDVSAVSAALTGLQDQLAGLPLTALLDGVTTAGVNVTALGATAQSRYVAAAAAVVPAAIDPGTTAAVNPVTPVAQTLPRTGGGLGLAVVLAAAGAAGLSWLRRRPART